MVRISPQEIANYAMSGMDELLSTQRTLNDAMLFDGRDRRIIGEKLKIDLCFWGSVPNLDYYLFATASRPMMA